MARTPYEDAEAEKAYQDIQDQSSQPSAPLEDDRLSLHAEGNAMLRDRSLGPHNVKVNKNNGYGR